MQQSAVRACCERMHDSYITIHTCWHHGEHTYMSIQVNTILSAIFYFPDCMPRNACPTMKPFCSQCHTSSHTKRCHSLTLQTRKVVSRLTDASSCPSGLKTRLLTSSWCPR